MLAKFTIWIIQKILIGKLRRTFGKDNLVAIKGLLNNYSSVEYNRPTHNRNRPTYVKEFKKIFNNEEFLKSIKKLMNQSQYLTVCEDIYLASIFINRLIIDEDNVVDFRKKKYQNLFDETISHLDYLVFNYKL